MPEKKHSVASGRIDRRYHHDRRGMAVAGTRDPENASFGSYRHQTVDKRPSPRSGERSYVAIRIALMCLIGPISASAAEVDAVTVQRAIDRGIAYLRKTQSDRGGWKEFPGYSCGKSALCTLALLNAGVPRDDPAMVRALKYLRRCEPEETYSVALQTMVYCQLGAAGDLPRIHRNVQWLEAHQKGPGTMRSRIGSWDYGRNRGMGDPSNSQFALLALGAAHDRGIEVDAAAFERALRYWLVQQQDGGWAYPGRGNSGSMTCAGIASVIIARGRLGQGTSAIEGDRIRCCGAQGEDDDPVATGLQWLADNFSVQINPGGGQSTLYYYLYALERVGRLSGRRLIGDHDWYREGAERLIELQDDFQGFWRGSGSLEGQEIATSFALLFLSKGKRQVVVGRVKYQANGAANAWQRHPDSLRQLVRHVEYQWRRDLTWQTIDLAAARLQDLLQAPVLVISGNRALRLTPAAVDRLKEYVDQGGCILFDADGDDGCGDSKAFESSVRALTQRWYPGAELEKLPPSHPIWFAEQNVDPGAIDDDYWVSGVQACCRTAVFYSPRSLSCRWELADLLFRRDQGPPAARDQIDAAVRIGQNLIAYATGRELKDKLDSALVINADSLPPPNRHSIPLAMLALDAGGEEASRALPNAAALIAAKTELPLSAPPQPIGFDAEELAGVPVLWIHGRTRFEFTESQVDVLRQYIETGGVIFGSAVCGAKEFAESFRRELKKVLPDAALAAVGSDHPIMTASDGFDIRSVRIRTPAAGKPIAVRQGPAVLELATADNLTAVVFSPLDVSCALESPNSVQCPGYSTETAAKIVANVVLHSLQQ